MTRAAQVARALAAVVVVAVSACQTAPTEKVPSTPDITAAEVEALIPDYTTALDSNPNDYVAFLKSWFQAATPEIDADDIVRYGLAARDRTAKLAAEKVIAGTQAFCSRNGGQIEKAPPALVCMGPDQRPIARLSVQVFDSSSEQPGALQFTGESAAWIARLNEAQLADYRRVVDTLSRNGIGGGVLLSSGQSFEVARFGRLSAPDFYALKTPNHGLIFLEDVVSVKWAPDAISIVQRGGERIEENGTGLAPGNTIVRLRPTDDGQLKAEPLTPAQPFRFVTIDSKSKQPRQVRVRADALIVEITVSRSAPKYRGGPIQARFDKKEADAFRRALVADARKTAASTGKQSYALDLDNPKLRADLDQIGRVGPCARTQSEDRLRSGDIAYTEYLACTEYRQEAEAVISNGGELTPDKTPLLFLGRSAQAPWYDFGGVLR
ncbi:MAG TPA: hypothetical protein VML56_09835 [Burkholderiales bacterium]|nr:hypothetical protein [Burkholderiales bacterium]